MSKTCLDTLREKLFRFLIILIDVSFGLFHFFMKKEDRPIRYASVFKFISTGVLNALDALQIKCRCLCCIRKSAEEEPIDDEKMAAKLDEKLSKLQSKKEILERLEKKKTNPKYSEMISKVKTIEKLEKEIKEKIEIILA